MKLNEIYFQSGTTLTEAMSLGQMQSVIYAYVLKTMKGVPSSAASEAKNDRFWVAAFDDVFDDLRNGHVDSLYDSISVAIEEVSNAIVDYYGDTMNHQPGYKAVKLKIINQVPEKDLIAIVKELDSSMIDKHLENKKQAVKASNDVLQASRKQATTRIVDIAKIFKKYEANGWKNFLKMIKGPLAKNQGQNIVRDYFPTGTSLEQVQAIKSEADLKALFKKPSDLISCIADSIFNDEKLSKEEQKLVHLAYSIASSESLSKKLIALL